MDSNSPTFASRTPLRIGAAGLAVRDLDRCVDFYTQVIGLEMLEREKDCACLGAGGTIFLELEHRPEATPDDPAAAGLFHTAFLMPTRADLARWLAHVAQRKQPLDGASDHIVSEAIYLSDPEGNGIEVYADRPREAWQRNERGLDMGTYPLDLQDLLGAGSGEAWRGVPAGLRIGHIHLRVGDTEHAERFYGGTVGLEIMATVPGASFLSSGGYHHHLGANTWRSRGAGPRDPRRAGLAWFSLEAERADLLEPIGERLRQTGTEIFEAAHGGLSFQDPWGTPVRLMAA